MVDANNCYRDSLPMLLEEAVQWKAVAGAGAVGRARGQQGGDTQQ
jgi:hypothetical protein